jgi:hypothetical protein
MNAISHDTAYALFPRATFEERRSLVCTKSAQRREIALEKYGARGWRVLTRLSRHERQDSRSSFHVAKRSVQDCCTWRLSLPLLPLPLTESTGGSPSSAMRYGMVDLRTSGEWNFEYQTVPKMVFLPPSTRRLKVVRMRAIRRGKEILPFVTTNVGGYHKSRAVA